MGIALVAAGGPHQQHDRPVGLVLSEPLFSGMALCSAGAYVGRVGMYSCMVGLHSSRSDYKKSMMYRHAVVSTLPRAATSGAEATCSLFFIASSHTRKKMILGYHSLVDTHVYFYRHHDHHQHHQH